MRVTAVGVIALASTVALTSEARAKQASTGLRGVVMLGPTKPAPLRRIGKGLTPRVVRVHRGQIAAADFQLDTGIQ